MTSPIIIVCAFFSIISAALCSQCLHCGPCNHDNCHEEFKNCSKDSKCIVMSEYYEVKGNITQTIYKDCAEHLPCDQVLSISSDSGLHAIINYTCCSGDNCNTAKYEKPQQEGGPNGKICPTCFATNTVN
ncbi:uncharacterized protein O3C94_014210 [Discoglossus pictus]